MQNLDYVMLENLIIAISFEVLIIAQYFGLI